ncbi:MAG TPA: sodium:solute symporter family protein [Prolixibacteraceae bacterium]|nr:sodium:solute symporter family protein [Prolixibacteraceae bacterium]
MSTTVIILIAYLLILTGIAVYSYRKVSNYTDFFIARKSGNVLFITGSLTATILGGSAIIGAIDEGPSIGWATSWYMTSAAIGLFILIPLIPRVSHFGKYSLPDLLGNVYQNKQAKTISSLIIPVAWIGIIAAQIIAAARILQSFTGMDYSLGVLVSGSVFILYTLTGGQFSVLKTDLFQAILILVGLSVISFFVFLKSCAPIQDLTPLKFPFNIHFGPVDLVILLITYSSTFTFGPDIYSRIFCSKNNDTAKKSVFLTALILLFVACCIGLISAFGSRCITPSANGSLMIDVCQQVLPTWSVGLVVLALLSAVLSSAATTILSASIIVTDLIEKGNFGNKTFPTTRICMTVVGIVSILIALNFTSIIGILMIALTVYSGAFMVPILFGLTGVKIAPNALTPAVIAGGATALAGKILFSAGITGPGNAVIISSFILNGIILLWNKKSHTK